MINFFKVGISIFIAFFLLNASAYGQACFTPSINAQAGTGPSTVVCLGQCANLTATVVPPPKSTTSYSVGSVSYSTMPYSGGSNAFATTLDDTWSDVINIGFNFCYFGNTYDKCVVGSNGEITFNLASANTPEPWVCSAILPNLVEHPPNTICGIYRDYDPYPGGVIRTYTAGVAPCRRFVTYWSAVTLYSCVSPLSSFQIILYEGSNNIAVNIVNSTACVAWNNGRGLIGIQNATGSTAVAPPTRNVLTPWTAINESWLFVPTAAPSYSVSWAGPSSFTASGLSAAPCPTATGNYTATMSYCSGSVSSVVQVSVGTPPVMASTSSSIVCPTSPATLTGSGATSYTWQTPSGNITSPTIVVSPTIATTYTLFGNNGICTASTTILINVTPSPTISAFNLSGTICSGGSANCIATGALSYTWYPGAIVGNIVALSPTITTTYTIVGSAGSCTNQTNLVVPVNNGPTLTVISSPTAAICPGNSATLSASGALSYTWNPGGTVASSIIVSPLITTNYSVTGINAFGCTSTATINQIVNPVPNITITPASSSICIGSSATLTASGASSYTWIPGGLTTAVVIVTPTTTTNYTIVGSNGTCTNSTTSLLTVVPIPTVSASSSTANICSGNSVTLTGFGATNYTWNPGSLTGASVITSPTITTTYTLIGAVGACSSQTTLLISVTNGPTLAVTSTPTTICSGASATLSASGALTYTWNPGAIASSSIVISPVVTTNYSVSGTNASGCVTTNTLSYSVTPTPTLIATSSSTAICAGNSATLSSSGATTYTWNPGAFVGGTITVTPVTNTTYTVIGSNGNCTSSKTIALVINTNPTITASASPTLICSGNSSTLTGNGAISYTWNPGALAGGTITVTPAITTTYTLIGSNAAGCTNSATSQVSVNVTPTLNPIVTPTAICVGSTATLSTGGALTYTWNPGNLNGSSVTVTPLTTTIYTVTGSNGNCTDTKTISLLVSPVPTVNATSNPTAICNGASATLTAIGAASYTWSPGNIVGNSITVNPTSTTLYTVMGSNGGCASSATVNLVVNPTPTITAISNPTNVCIGSSATLSSSGAVSYTWNPGALIGGTVAVVPASTTLYTVTGSNAFGCTTTNTVNLIVTPIPTVNAVASNTAICSGSSTTLTASGATTYTWMPGALTGANIIVTPTITTTYSVTGSNGACTDTKTITIIVNPTPTITAVTSPTNICSGSSATLSSSGAVSYTWNPGALIGGTVAVVPASTTLYTVTGSNAFGCTTTNTVNLIVTPIPTITAVASPTAICSGASSTLTANGATSYTWMPGTLIGNNITVTPTTTTTYTVFGANGTCSSTQTITVIVNPLPVLIVSSSPTAICSGASATLIASGATAYNWLPGALAGSLVVVSPTITTSYTVIGTSALGCSNSATVNLIVNPIPTLTVSATPTNICIGNSSTLSASGATSYTWNPGALFGGTVTVTPASTTIYNVTGFNAFGCTATKTLNLIVTPIPTVNAVASPTAICIGASSTLTASGANSYVWNPGALTGTNIVVTPTTTTTYTLLGSNGTCSNTKTITLVVNPLPTLLVVSSPTAICSGFSSTLTASGGLTYTWSPSGSNSSSIVVTPAITTNYTVTSSNAFGCTKSTTISVIVRPTPTLNIIATSTTICSGNSTTLTGTAFGGGPFTSVWNPGAIVGNIAVVSPTVNTTYSWTVQNVFGCVRTRTIAINVNVTPTVIASTSNSTLCVGNSATLSATGASTYTWNPGSIIGSSIIVTPTVNTTYSVIGANGSCTNTKTVAIIVNPTPTLTATSSATSICVGTTVTLTANGSGTYTWNPTGLTTATIVDTPTLTTTYTVSSNNAFGCTGTSTIMVVVNSIPSLTVSPLSATVCSGYATTLTAMGATNYTWLPSGNTTSTTIETPTVNTTYTVIGENGVCASSFTVDVFINPLPANLIATTSGSITCTAPTVTLTGSSTTTSVSYVWTGPFSYTSSIQNPTVNVQGTYTFSVIDNITGCVASVTLDVPTDSSIPSVTATTSGSITCSNNSVTINVATTSTNVSYSWTGPSSFTTAAQTFTSTQFGTYTVTVTDLSSTCSSTAIVSVGIHTNVIVTASITPATCTGSVSNNDGTISVLNFTVTDKYDYVSGITYTGSAVYLTATTIPITGIITNTLANPTGTVAYTIRLFDAEGCIKDTTLILYPINCLSVKSLGIAKAVSTPTLNSNGSYDINYTVVVKNYGLLPLNDVTLTEDLNSTFPLPTTFTVISAPILTSAGSSLTIEPAFDGNTQTSLTTSSISILNVGQTDTIVFGVRIFTNGFFGPFNNSVIGLASPSPNVFVTDSSHIGLDPDSDFDNDPTNNNTPTPIQFAPNLFFGLTKTATLSDKLSDNTYDITYTITVHNLGNDTLKNITVKDSLFAKTVMYPASFTIKSGPTTTGSLTANSSFNGNSDINLLIPGLSLMPPGNVNTIIFTINVNPDTVTIFKNSAYGTARSTSSVLVSDTSNAGTNPDANGNGIWNEASDNVPTVVIIPNTTFFIPEGFTPNGDNKNDVFVIKGLPVGIDNVLTVFNRWGNKVYSKSNYDNTWNGTPNVNGTMGNEKLPQGTYYYIIEFKGGDIKTTNGYVILQY